VLPDKLMALAGTQAGAFTSAQAAAHGLDAGGLSRLRRGRRLVVVRRHVYALADVYAQMDAPQRIAVAASARMLVTAGDLVASHQTAAALRSWTLLGPAPVEPQLTCAVNGNPPPRAPGISHATLPAEHRDELLGVRTTSAARTLADCARTLEPQSALVTADSALRHGAGRSATLALIADHSRWPGSRQAREIVAFADARADSALESRTRWCLALQGLPPPELQLTICDEVGRDVGEVDFVWRAHRTILETDGRVKYEPDGSAAWESRGVLWREKLREDALRELGFEVVRGYWSDLADDGRVLAERIRRAFAMVARYHRTAPYGSRERPIREAQRLR
jgi:very-short-patch-repair endonuclease